MEEVEQEPRGHMFNLLTRSKNKGVDESDDALFFGNESCSSRDSSIIMFEINDEDMQR